MKWRLEREKKREQQCKRLWEGRGRENLTHLRRGEKEGVESLSFVLNGPLNTTATIEREK